MTAKKSYKYGCGSCECLLLMFSFVNTGRMSRCACHNQYSTGIFMCLCLFQVLLIIWCISRHVSAQCPMHKQLHNLPNTSHVMNVFVLPTDCRDIHLNIPADEFVSKKITNKLVQQIQV